MLLGSEGEPLFELKQVLLGQAQIDLDEFALIHAYKIQKGLKMLDKSLDLFFEAFILCLTFGVLTTLEDYLFPFAVLTQHTYT